MKAPRVVNTLVLVHRMMNRMKTPSLMVDRKDLNSLASVTEETRAPNLISL